MLGREEYIKWDKDRLEREDIANRLRNNFPNLSVTLGGQTGLDLGPLGSDKSQIIKDFRLGEELHFFGDRMEKGGNDYSLGKAVQEMGGKAYHVKDWRETQSVIISSVAERDNKKQLAY